jgi:predicted alpha/beta hydrolase family esterase
LLLLQARKYLIAHSTGTVTTARAMMERQKKQGNQFPHRKN